MNQKHKRLGIIDYCRIISAVAVIVLHVTAPYSDHDDTCYFINQMCRFAVPLFFLLSGMSLYNGYKDSDRIEPVSFYRRRFGKILIPYVLWTFIYLIYLARGDITRLTWRFILGKSVFGVGHLYFMLIVMQAYIFFPLLFKLYRLNPKAMVAASFIITLYFNMASVLTAWGVYIGPPSWIGLYYMMFLSWMFFFVFGMYAADNYEYLLAFTRRNRWTLWCGTYICFMLITGIGRMTDTYASSMKPSIIIYGILVFLSLFSATGRKQAGPVAIWLSEQSFAVYLCHMLMLGFVKGYFLISGFDLETTPLLIAITTLLSSLFFVYIASHIRYCESIGVISARRYRQHDSTPNSK